MYFLKVFFKILSDDTYTFYVRCRYHTSVQNGQTLYINHNHKMQIARPLQQTNHLGVINGNSSSSQTINKKSNSTHCPLKAKARHTQSSYQKLITTETLNDDPTALKSVCMCACLIQFTQYTLSKNYLHLVFYTFCHPHPFMPCLISPLSITRHWFAKHTLTKMEHFCLKATKIVLNH